MYIISDHTRTVMMVVTDGLLPSTIGGGSNIRNIIRRLFRKEQLVRQIRNGLDYYNYFKNIRMIWLNFMVHLESIRVLIKLQKKNMKDNTVYLPETENLYYTQILLQLYKYQKLLYQTPKDGKFQTQIFTVFSNVQQQNLPNIVILNQSAFYPFRGGQENDQGWSTIQGTIYFVIIE